MLKKIALTLTVLILAVGIVSAVDMTDMKVPDGFEKYSSNCFEKDDFELNLVSYSDSDKGLIFEDDEDYTVSEYSSNIYKYTDKLVKNVGAVELVEIDGDKYLVECVKKDTTTEDSSVYDYITEFNSLNDLTPIEP